jgi:hypothetical protein
MRIWMADDFLLLLLAVTLLSLPLGLWRHQFLARRAVMRLHLEPANPPALNGQ